VLVELLDLAALLTDDALPNLAAAPILRDASFASRISGAADTASRRKSWKRIARAIAAAGVPATAVD
jgi:hypothetical protein